MRTSDMLRARLFFFFFLFKDTDYLHLEMYSTLRLWGRRGGDTKDKSMLGSIQASGATPHKQLGVYYDVSLS